MVQSPSPFCIHAGFDERPSGRLLETYGSRYVQCVDLHVPFWTKVPKMADVPPPDPVVLKGWQEANDSLFLNGFFKGRFEGISQRRKFGRGWMVFLLM